MGSASLMHHRIWIAVTGGRDYDDYRHVARVLDEERDLAPSSLVIVQGECPYGGADELAKEWCRKTGTPCFGLPAWFGKLGRGAGPIRNGWMLDFLPIYKLIAFPGDRGTNDCVQQAIKREILVRDERTKALAAGEGEEANG